MNQPVQILNLLRIAATAGAVTLAAPIAAGPVPSLAERVAQVLDAAPTGTRFGLLVTSADGREVIAINPDGRFIPASNTKLFTTAAAYALLAELGERATMIPEQGSSGTLVGLTADTPGVRDVVLFGRGDARMSSAASCEIDCLATLADAIAAKTRRVRNVVGDDRWFPDQRWSPGMSWNNIGTDSGTATSALTLDDNELPVVVTPGAVGAPPAVEISFYYTLRNEAVTIAQGKTALTFERAPNGIELRLYGEIAATAVPYKERLGIDDPAHYAAWTLRRMLEARGVSVRGAVQVRHRPVSLRDDPERADRSVALDPPPPVTLAMLSPPPLRDDVVTINKVSQNLHAELLLRRFGRLAGTGSIADGLAQLELVLTSAGVPRTGYDFADGSGMSSYNRVSPRAAVALLRWASTQSWGTAWRASLPIGGVDGTLKRRFADSPLKGSLWAKTGTLNATNALSGYLRAASGQELIFSFFANDIPQDKGATAIMDAALEVIAAAN